MPWHVIAVIYACMAAVAILAAGVLAWLVPSFTDVGAASLFEFRCVIVILGVSTAVALMGSVFGGVLVGIQRIDIERAVLVSTGLLRLLLTVGFLTKESNDPLKGVNLTFG